VAADTHAAVTHRSVVSLGTALRAEVESGHVVAARGPAQEFGLASVALIPACLDVCAVSHERDVVLQVMRDTCGINGDALWMASWHHGLGRAGE
jgi:hypothetical protein